MVVESIAGYSRKSTPEILRDWHPFTPGTDGCEPITHHVKGSIPLSATGEVKIGLWLPDTEEDLREIPAYSIQFANEGMDIWTGTGKLCVNRVGAISVSSE